MYHCSPNYVIMCTLLQLTYSPVLWNPQCAVRHFKSSHSDITLHLPVAAVTVNKAVIYYTVIYGRITYSFFVANSFTLQFRRQYKTFASRVGTVLFAGHSKVFAATDFVILLTAAFELDFFSLKSWNFKDWLSINLDPLQ